MIGAEFCLAITALCVPNVVKRSNEENHLFVCSSGASSFTIAGGLGLEFKMIIDLKNIVGVRDASVQRKGNTFSVNVLLESLDFPPFEKVVAKEMELSEQYPDFRFDFDIMPVEQQATPAIHAA